MKTYRFRMEPTKAQDDEMSRIAGCRRFVWNWALARWKEYYAEHGKTIPYRQLSAELTQLKKQPGMEWLDAAPANAMQQAPRDLFRAFAAFFKGNAKYPRFKSKKRDTARFRATQDANIANGKIHVQKVGKVRIRQSREIKEKTKSATFKRDSKGHWFVTVYVEFEVPDTVLPPIDSAKVIGIDLGLKDFATFSDGTEPIPAPRFYRQSEKRQRKAHRVFSRRQVGSKRKAKAAKRVAIIRTKAANQRADFLHKLTTGLVRQYDILCIEDLSVRGLARTKLAKSVTDASFGEFRRQLTYKAEWNRKHLVVIDRYFPSSKTCNSCGTSNESLTLKDRKWDCVCGARNDRDLNAARNIRDEGLRHLMAGHADSIKAQGADVSPASCGLSAGN